jgi:hypothetical protein
MTIDRLLLAPHLVAFYQYSVQHIQYGDYFLFEDAVGRVKRLPCAQFQQWNVRPTSSFENLPSLTLLRISISFWLIASKRPRA